MNYALLDLYSDYLLSSFSATTATGLSRLMNDDLSHDQVSRMLNSRQLEAKDWWLMIKPHIRTIQRADGVLTIDDSIVEKEYTDENEIICWHYDHAKEQTVKGINFITTLYTVGDVSLPVTLRLVAKTEHYVNKEGKPKRRSPVTKNEYYRAMLQQCVRNQIPFKYVLNDLWFAAAENMGFVKLDLKKEFIMALKANRKVALLAEDKQQGRYQRLNQLDVPEDTPIVIYLEQVSFREPPGCHLMRQVFTNADGRVPTGRGVRYLVTSDLTLTADQLATIYQKRWKVEEYHRSLKQNASLDKSPTRTRTTQTNHFVAALWSFAKLELLKVRTKKNHYALKTQLYISALQSAFDVLQQLQPIRLHTSTA
jgi:DDE superfamily endonuclease